MLVLCMLQNAWGNENFSNRLNIFRVNPLNKSGARMLRITEGHDMWFSNVSPTWTNRPNKVGEPCLVHTEKMLRKRPWEAVIICGKNAEQTIDRLITSDKIDDLLDKTRFLYMPHPASRSLTNELCDWVTRHLNLHEGHWQFIQLKGSVEIHEVKFG